MTIKPTAEVSVEDKALIEEFMWQTKQDQHNICGQYNPTFCDKVEKRLTQLLTAHTTALKGRILEIINPKLPEGFATTGNCTHGSLSGLCGKCAQDKLLKIEKAITNIT